MNFNHVYLQLKFTLIFVRESFQVNSAQEDQEHSDFLLQ